MPLIAGLGALLASVTKVLIAYRIVSLVLKVATRLLIFGIILAAFISVLASIQAAVNTLNANAPPMLGLVYSWFVPSNFTACLSVIVTVQLIIWAWHWKQYAFNMMAGGVN